MVYMTDNADATHITDDPVQTPTVLIVGASGGIGAETALTLGQGGYRVIACARNSAALHALSTRFGPIEHQVFTIDAEDEAVVKNMLSSLKAEGVRLDAIVCVAGRHMVKPIRISRSGDYLSMFLSNFITASNVITNASSLLNAGASIVLVGSAATQRAAAGVSAYASTKLALEGFARSAALEFAPRRVRINVVSPGVVATDASKIFFDKAGPDGLGKIIDRHPLGLGEISDVVSLIRFLISSDSKWITGQNIFVDGGFSIQG